MAYDVTGVYKLHLEGTVQMVLCIKCYAHESDDVILFRK